MASTPNAISPSSSASAINTFLYILMGLMLMEASTFVFVPMNLAQFGMKHSSLVEAAKLPIVSGLLFPVIAAFQVSLAYLCYAAARAPQYAVKVLACRILTVLTVLLLPVNLSMFDMSVIGRPAGQWWDPSNHNMAVVNSVLSILPLLPGLWFSLQSTAQVIPAAGKPKGH